MNTKKNELLEKLNRLSESGDSESAHVEADSLVLEYIGDKEITEAFLKLERWYA